MIFDVIMAFHNRRSLTLASVRSLFVAADRAGVNVSLMAFDDGSTDGTSEALMAMGKPIDIVQGDGSAFWARSMATVEGEVVARNRSDKSDKHVLTWLNDDVILDEDALVRATLVLAECPDSVIVGAMRDPGDNRITYSGFKKQGWHPLKFASIEPSDKPRNVDTFNGNFVLVPLNVAEVIGPIDGGFAHALADLDYGLRAIEAGLSVILAPGSFGTCPRNSALPHAGVIQEWRRYVGVKGGGNFASNTRMIRRHSPGKWPWAIAASYLMWWLRELKRVRQRGRWASSEQAP